MRNNVELQRDVYEAIKFEPLLSASEIGVTAKDGVVTLTGIVDSYAKKWEAEDAAKKVAGVKAVVEAIVIQFHTNDEKSDNDIAVEVLDALKANWIPEDKVKIKVEDGWVTLEGELEWNYQKDAIKKAVRNLEGVKVLSNDIVIKALTNNEVEKKGIERAFSRNWSIEGEDITVDVRGNRVTLIGHVHSFYQKDEAERIAWNAPGVVTVDNELSIQ